jgi:hypothetical protein
MEGPMAAISQSSPKTIPFYDLTTKYHFNRSFNEEEVEEIYKKLNQIDFSKHLSRENFKFPETAYWESEKKLHSYFSPEWNLKTTTRNAVLSNDIIPNFVIKTYHARPSIGHPMASILRVPMAHFIQDTIKVENLVDIEVPTKGLIPLPECQIENADKYNISQLDEHNINEAFLVVAKKIKFMPNPVEILKEIGADKQQKLAVQACIIPEKTGLADFGWHNLKLTNENKLAIIDTEPLWGGLFVDRFGKGYARCNELFEYWTLEKSAKYGLENFGESSTKHELPIFHDTAQKFLEKHD